MPNEQPAWRGGTALAALLFAFVGGAGGAWVYALISRSASADSVAAVVLPTVATIAAAYVGASYAFELERTERLRQQERADINAANSVLLGLLLRYNRLASYRRQFIEPFKDDPRRWIRMRPSPALATDLGRLPVTELLFLLDLGHAELLGRLEVAQDRYDSTIGAINLRSQLVVGQVQPKLAALGVREGVGYDAASFEQALGDELVFPLKRLTDDIVNALPQDEATLLALGKELHASIKVSSPSARVLRFEPSETP